MTVARASHITLKKAPHSQAPREAHTKTSMPSCVIRDEATVKLISDLSKNLLGVFGASPKHCVRLHQVAGVTDPLHELGRAVVFELSLIHI